MVLVAGVDSSSQSCKVLIVDAESGRVVRRGSFPHAPGSEVDPANWWSALRAAIDRAGGLRDVEALAIAGQQHGMVCLDADGQVVRPALLWNDTRSAAAAHDLIRELGHGDMARGATLWAEAVGSVPVASYTITKLRWLAEHEPENAARVAAVALPHDWLSWRLAGARPLDRLFTDRSDASGTGYWSPTGGEYRRDLLALALRREVPDLVLPRVLGPCERAGRGDPSLGLGHLVLGPGCGDNAGVALGLGLAEGQVSVSIGTSGVVAAVSSVATSDDSGTVSGFADATGRHLALVCTLNGAQIIDSAARLLGVGQDDFNSLALAADADAGGLVYVPYLQGERTPNLPDATGSLHGMTLDSLTRENVARAAVHGLLCLLGGGIDALRRHGTPVDQVTLIGGGARSPAVRQLASPVLGLPVRIPEPEEFVAIGAARQAAWTLTGGSVAPAWRTAGAQVFDSPATPEVRQRFDRVAAAACA